MPPMVLFNLAAGNIKNEVTEKHIQHYEARAKGGAGLIIIEAACVNPAGQLVKGQLGLWSDSHIEGFRRIAQACHQYGAIVLAQIHHAGISASPEVTDKPIAPANFRGIVGPERMAVTARGLALEEVHSLQKDFVSAALRAQQAGLDGVELHGAHGYLVSQFFSPLINNRKDAYGGSPNKRTNFATEIISQIRKAAGNDFLISCRMGANEPDLNSSLLIARELEKAGVDMLHISFGFIPPMAMRSGESPEVPPGFDYNWVVYGGTEIKKQARGPVIVSNNITSSQRASNLIEKGLADFTSIGRSLLVDPEWANKAKNEIETKNCIDCKPACSRFNPRGICPQEKS